MSEHPKDKMERLDWLVKKTEACQVEPSKNIDLTHNINNPREELKKVHQSGRPSGSENKNIGFRKKDLAAMEKAAKVLWEAGHVFWKLDKAQMRMYESYKNRKGDELVWVVTRQAIGKSFCAGVIAIEECMNKPNFRVAYVSPQKAQTREVVDKNIGIILSDCPERLRPKYDTQRGIWKFNNGSIIKIVGIDGGHIDNIRGQTFDLVMLDEAGFPSPHEFEYAMESVIYPTMTRADKPLLLMFTTPPESFDHPFNDYWERAEINGNLVFMTLYDSCLPPADIAKIEERYGKDSVHFRREFMCEKIPNYSNLVVPEATEQKMSEIIKDVKVPDYYKCYVSADYGVMDANAILFAYHDFLNNQLVIVDELMLTGQEFDTQRMALAIKEKEAELWAGKTPSRYCDNNLQIIRDFSVLYHLNFLATSKDNKQAHVNQVRMKIQNKEIVISSKCVNLISHIKNATWDKNRQKFKRALNHHYDFLDALIYLVRNVDYNHNPYPHGYILKGDFISPKYKDDSKSTEFSRHMKEIFTAKKNRYRKK
jgi:hypothetical protein